MRCSTLRGTFSSLITLATPRQDWTGSNPSRREGGGCGFILSRFHSCCAVRLVYIQISPGHIWTTLYHNLDLSLSWHFSLSAIKVTSLIIWILRSIILSKWARHLSLTWYWSIQSTPSQTISFNNYFNNVLPSTYLRRGFQVVSLSSPF